MSDRITLIKAVITGKLGEVQMLIEQSKNVHINQTRNDSGSPLISLAVAYRHEDIVSYLLKMGADITIKNTSGSWPTYDDRTRLTQGNALDVAVFKEHTSIIKMLLVHAALHLNTKAQASLLSQFEDKNVLLHVAHVYPGDMQQLIDTINEKASESLKIQLLTDLMVAADDKKDKQSINQYLASFQTEPNTSTSYLSSIDFDSHFKQFKTLGRDEAATQFITALARAKATLVLTGNVSQFNEDILEAIEDAASLSIQPLWQQAIVYLLESLACIFPISRNFIPFFKESDTAQRISALKEKVAAPILAQAVVVPEASAPFDESLQPKM